jgi:outer membrane protein
MKHMRSIAKKTTAAFLLALCGGSSVFGQEVIRVEEAVQRALANNLQVKQAEFQVALSDQDLLQSKMAFYPNLNAGGSGSFNWGLSFDQTSGQLVTQSVNSAGIRLSSGMDLFQGFQRTNQVRANRLQLLSNESNVDRVKNDLVLSVTTTYLDALTNQDLMLAALEQQKLSKQQLEIMRINVDVGQNTMADLAQAQSQAATDELNMTNAQNAYELSVLNLKQLMEMDPNVSIELVKPNIDEVKRNAALYSAAEVFNKAVQVFPEIKVAEYNRLIAERSIAIAKGSLYPTLSINGGIGTNYSSQARDFVTGAQLDFMEQFNRNRSQSVGFSLNIPIFNNWRSRVAINKSKINYNNALVNEQLAKNNLNKIIHQAVLDLRSAEQRLSASELSFASAKAAFEVIQLRFNEGLATALELSTAQTNMNRAEFEAIQARYNVLFRSKVIDYYLGNPITF